MPPSVATGAVRSYRTLSPLPAPSAGRRLGGLLSVALSVGSRPPGVTWRLALGARTFLHACAQRLSGRLRPRWWGCRERNKAKVSTASVAVGAAMLSFARSSDPQRCLVQLAALAAGELRGDLRCLRRRQLFAATRAAARPLSSSVRCARRRRAAHDDHDLAARHVAVALRCFAQLRERAAVCRLEALRQLAADRRAALRAEDRAPCRAGLPRADAALRRRSACALRARAARARSLRAAVFARQKAFENEAIGRQARDESAAIAAHGAGNATTARRARAPPRPDRSRDR